VKIAVLRAYGVDFDVDEFLRTFAIPRPDSVWRRGEPRGRNEISEDSGFNATLADSDETSDVMAEVRRVLGTLAPAISSLRDRRVRIVLDIGVTFEVGKDYSKTTRFEPIDLLLVGELGLTLDVSVYAAEE
jgi:hypothetical protein